MLIASVALAACGGGAGPGPAGPTPGGAPAPIEYVPLTTGLPAIPRVEAPLSIRVIHPTPGSARPGVDSTFIYGNVGTGDAALVINGVQVPVAPNGAFIAYLPTPRDAWRLEAWKGAQRSSASVAYRAPVPADSAQPQAAALPIPEGVLAAPRGATVTGGGDTLATGSDAIYARPTPTGTYRWFFPRGARLAVAERRGTQYRVQLDDGASAWINASAVTLGDAAPAPAELRNVQIAPAPEGEDLIVGTPWLPFLVEADSAGVRVTLYNATPGQPLRPDAAGDVIRGVTATAAGARTVRLDLALAGPAWGYKAFYRPDGALVVRVRRAPPIDAANPLRGIRIVVDPGHPPAGATGPTGLREAEANLPIALRLAEKLRAAGAEVVLTRTGAESVELADRTRLAVERNGHLLVSVHNNAFGEGQNPFRSHHTSTYYFHPFSAALARSLNREIAAVVQIPNRGALVGNLALARPTWMPSVLTESLFMPIPEQESALRDPAFLERLADAHFRGIEAFLRSAAAR